MSEPLLEEELKIGPILDEINAIHKEAEHAFCDLTHQELDVCLTKIRSLAAKAQRMLRPLL